ncbi:MAG TPA: type III pantothenate kinase [Thermoleophilaceae bacterium]|nr:type III pantothenate kinase [Thermoleophilaceae bacterium]
MLLAIDVGNTQSHIGLYSGEDLVEHWRLATDRDATVDRLAIEVAGLLGLRGLGLPDVDGAIVCSVVPVLTHEFELLSERYFEGAMLVVRPGVKTGMAIRVENPHEVGADRLVNAVAAYERVGGTCIAVDFGTAINYDVVSSKGEYLGGVIAPGVEISLDALSQRAARLFKVDLETPASAIGRSTQAAVQSGIVFGFAAQVDGILARLREELGEEATAIATGGHASVIAPHCQQIDETDDLLTLKGLRLVWERSREDG